MEHEAKDHLSNAEILEEPAIGGAIEVHLDRSHPKFWLQS
jgi:hypothetical protein